MLRIAREDILLGCPGAKFTYSDTKQPFRWMGRKSALFSGVNMGTLFSLTSADVDFPKLCSNWGVGDGLEVCLAHIVNYY